MFQYVVRRVIQSVVLLFIISVILFFLMNQSGDPLASLGGRTPPRAKDRERLECQYGLDKSLIVQYAYWVVGTQWAEVDCDHNGEPDKRLERKGVIRGDFGTSIVTRQPALQVILDRMENTLLLMGASYVVILLVASMIGILSALRPYSLFDLLLTGFAFVTYSMPIFFIAILLIYIFAINFERWGLPSLPFIGMYDPIVGKSFEQVATHLVLPVLSLAFIDIAKYSRYIRASMLEVLNADYIRTARAKGLSEGVVVGSHAMRNAVLPLVTLVGLDVPFLLAGAVVTEQIFAWPGMGQLFINSLTRSDFPVLMGILMMISAAVVVFQLLTDLMYTLLDPRIQLR